ncbi:uncharacterized protein LTR77_010688 [Saxophila tyrrhenica]|uniref:non-specific serine/threonine protein kinase n=1 Tax=Saxophila tyrrhenica TaxID=1690608 RepID=A0AAV9NVG4_9PEZI|nr:hypothetical protein LTR77_010688 [Saxophila tyrrhenica]
MESPRNAAHNCWAHRRKVISDIASLAATQSRNHAAQSLYQSFSQLLSDNDFYTHLGQMLPDPSRYKTPPRKMFREAEFERIAELLKLRGKPKWALRPRTYVVLYMTGLESAMDSFVAEERSDIYLPYQKGNLPNGLTGSERDLFLSYQNNVLTGRGAILERKGGAHQHFEGGSADTLFIYIRTLGTGMAGFQTQVDHVVGKRTLSHFALKKIGRNAFSKDDQRSIDLFANELDILKRLTHRHIVQLVGSYTDRVCVGLLMSPVADMNLAAFLKQPLDTLDDRRDRKIKIRSFFGCIATAIDYLHNNKEGKVRHKDIKPENILVKDYKVYIADFGTSYAWTGDVSGMTEGTQKFFTLKYLAPEAQYSQARGKPSDIWSLGCVFMEMCTVLADRKFEDIATFFNSSGKRRKHYYQNQHALMEWLKQLKDVFMASDIPHDGRIIELVEMMCRPEPDRRLEAQDLVRRIYELDGGPNYQGLCCYRDRWIRGSHTDPGPPSYAEAIGYDEEVTITAENLNFVDEPEEVMHTPLPENYEPPSVEEDQITLQAYGNVAPHEARNLLENVTVPLDFSDSEPQSAQCPVKVQVEKQLEEPREPNARHHERHDTVMSTGIIAAAEGDTDSTQLVSSEPSIDARSNPDHVETARPPVLLSVNPGPRGPHVQLPKHDPTSLPCPWPQCVPPKGLAILLFNSIEALRDHLRESHLVHDFGWTRLYEPQQQDRGITHSSSDPQTGAIILAPGPRRFVELPADRRPKPQNEEQSKRKAVRPQGISYGINAEPLNQEAVNDAMHTVSGGGTDGIPRASVAPSYLLASKNRFTRSEITSYEQKHRKPLFVYGTLMFPSVLTSRSRAFNTIEGTYSSEQGRRLRTNAADWANISEHVQFAAEAMTPARLDGYIRSSNSPSSRLACLRPAHGDESAKSTIGFLVYGLSDEASACLTHLYEKGGPQSLFRTSRREEMWPNTQLKLGDVRVAINDADGDAVYVEAVTFMLSGKVSKTESMPWDVRAHPPWNIDEFVRSRAFNRLTNDMEDGELISQEGTIASAIGTSLLLLGDKLVAKVLQNDVEGFEQLMDEGYDVDAPSAEYGTALQAAAANGNVTMARTLLRNGANASAKGGQYNAPLIAAVVEHQAGMVKLLLRADADVFAAGGRYISALYQAVDFGNYDMVYMLLEKGAWLTDDYMEVLDLATERGYTEIRRLLETYDARGLHLGLGNKRDRPRIQPQQERSRGSRESVHKRSSTAVLVMFEAMKLQGQEGKWTGIKGVKLVQIALENGFHENLLALLRPQIHSWPSIQKALSSGVGEMTGGKVKPVQHTNLLGADEKERSRSRSRDARHKSRGRRDNGSR